MRVNTGEHEWVEIEPAGYKDYYTVTFGYNDNKLDVTTDTTLDELRQIVAAIEKMEASDE